VCSTVLRVLSLSLRFTPANDAHRLTLLCAMPGSIAAAQTSMRPRVAGRIAVVERAKLGIVGLAEKVRAVIAKGDGRGRRGGDAPRRRPEWSPLTQRRSTRSLRALPLETYDWREGANDERFFVDPRVDA
jgi:hypothetical protein